MSQAAIQVGAMTITSVSDGILKIGLDVILGLAPKECSRLAGCAYDAAIWLPVNTFPIESGGQKLLIDASSGTNMQPTLGRLPESLRAVGALPESIETIHAPAFRSRQRRRQGARRNSLDRSTVTPY